MLLLYYTTFYTYKETSPFVPEQILYSIAFMATSYQRHGLDEDIPALSDEQGRRRSQAARIVGLLASGKDSCLQRRRATLTTQRSNHGKTCWQGGQKHQLQVLG